MSGLLACVAAPAAAACWAPAELAACAACVSSSATAEDEGMAYAAGGVDGDAGTGAATRRSTSGEATLADEGASAITGADRAVAIVGAWAVEMATPRDDSRSVLVWGALDASRLRAMV